MDEAYDDRPRSGLDKVVEEKFGVTQQARFNQIRLIPCVTSQTAWLWASATIVNRLR